MDKEEPKELTETIKEIKKKFGEGAIIKLKEKPHTDVDVISTGCLSLDVALGIGGVPRGRIIEIFGMEGSGKTTIACHIVAEVQREGGIAAFIDVEQALDPEYTEKIGVNLDELYLSQPSSAEEALQILEKLVSSGKIDVIVVDSVAALVPQAEIDGEMGELKIGLQARLMSASLRKLASMINQARTSVIFLNQIRMKVGCFQYSTRVVMEDGTTKKIGYLVNNKIKGKVLTYNLKNKRIEPKKITNWFKNGNANKFIQFIVERCEGNGRSTFACTPEHKILTVNGYKEAQNIEKGDEIMLVIYDWQLSSLQKEIIIGGLLGDGSLKRFKNGVKFRYREKHCKEQEEYIKWKSDYFNYKTVGKNSQGVSYFETFSSTIFNQDYLDFYENGKKVKVPKGIELTPLILAIWYQDDGYLANQKKKAIVLCTNCFRKSSITRLRNIFKDKFDIETNVYSRRQGKELLIALKQEGTKKFFDICSHFIHPSMRYKVPEEYKNVKFISPSKDFGSKKYIVRKVKVKEKYIKPRTKSMCKFDIETENHNYLANGVIVHNSWGNPETTSGGLALKFYSSVRLELRKGAGIVVKDEIVGNKIKVKVVKNKVAPPFKKTEFDIYYNQGIAKIPDLINIAVNNKVIKKGGAWLQYKDMKWQGQNEAIKFLEENPEIIKEIKKLVKETLNKKDE